MAGHSSAKLAKKIWNDKSNVMNITDSFHKWSNSATTKTELSVARGTPKKLTSFSCFNLVSFIHLGISILALGRLLSISFIASPRIAIKLACISARNIGKIGIGLLDRKFGSWKLSGRWKVRMMSTGAMRKHSKKRTRPRRIRNRAKCWVKFLT